MKPQCVAIQIKAIELCFHVVLFIMLYKMDQVSMCDHSYENYSALQSRGTVCYVVQGGSSLKFKSVDQAPSV